jgi:hypothetical protein
MYARQCLACGVIDGRATFDDENEARIDSEWECEHCGETEFEVVMLADEEPAAPVDDAWE